MSVIKVVSMKCMYKGYIYALLLVDYKPVILLLLVGVIGVINARFYYPPKPHYGYWSTWSSWAQCNVRCGGGTHSRSRHCRFDVRGYHGNRGCTARESPDIQRRACNTQCCPVNGGWSNWSQWSNVYGAPHHKLQERTRTCSAPYPSCGGRECFGDSRETRKGYY
ncbi:properdin-like [Watersipora subatra]|uniref:properdin-like n=1 Tax=Watersipora subatra TaxID=2589382 RepID=UPI00355C5AA8